MLEWQLLSHSCLTSGPLLLLALRHGPSCMNAPPPPPPSLPPPIHVRRLAYPLVLLSSVAQSTLKFARTQLEYMSDTINTAFMVYRDNPFASKRLKLAGSPADLQQLPQVCEERGGGARARRKGGVSHPHVPVNVAAALPIHLSCPCCPAANTRSPGP